MGGGRCSGAVPPGTPGVIGDSAGVTGSEEIIVIVGGANEEIGVVRLKLGAVAAGDGANEESEGTAAGIWHPSPSDSENLCVLAGARARTDRSMPVLVPASVHRRLRIASAHHVCQQV